MRLLISLFLILGSCFSSLESQAQLIINEVCSSNDIIIDVFGESSDWIELKNTGAEAINLSDYFLSDNASDLFQWQLPNQVLGSDETAIFFSESDYSDEVHFNFGINSDGETIYLSKFLVGLQQTLAIPTLRLNNSYGKSITSSDYVYYGDITPNDDNSPNEKQGYSTDFSFPIESGYYDDPLTINIDNQCTTGAIHITFDGSFPTEDSPLASGDFIVDNTSVVKAICVEDDLLPSHCSTYTYLIDENYDLPVVSLSLSHDSLFDPVVGLYMLGPDADPEWPRFGANFWDDRDLRTTFEYFEDGVCVFNHDVDLTIHGGKSSRNKPQRPFRLTARSKYGVDFMTHNFFEEKQEVDSFKHIILRNSGSDFLRTNYRDGFWHALAQGANLDFESFGFQPAVVLINGNYWGIMNLREKVSLEYLAQEQNISSGDLEHLVIAEKENYPFVGDTIHFYNFKELAINLDLSIPENYLIVQDQLDIKSYMDYFSTEIFAGNLDWPSNNIKFWNPNPANSKWRYIMFDLDTTMRLFSYIPYDADMFEFIFVDKSWSINSKIFISLMENAEFKRLFINRLADLMNTSFSEENLLALQHQIETEIGSEIDHHFSRWNGDFDRYKEETLTILPDFHSLRKGYVQEHVLSHFDLPQVVGIDFDVYPSDAGEIKINSIQPELPFSGEYFTDNAIDISAIPNGSSTFLRWDWKPIETGFVSNSEDPSFGVPVIPSLPAFQRNFINGGTLTAIFEDDNSNGFFVIGEPSPNGPLNCIFESDITSRCSISVFSPEGKSLAAQGGYPVNKGSNKFSIELPQLSSGLYLVRLVQEGKTFTAKFFIP